MNPATDPRLSLLSWAPGRQLGLAPPRRPGPHHRGRDPTEAAMIERHITFNVHPDRTDASSSSSRAEYGPTMAKAPGFVRVELLREADSATRYQMVLRFEDAESAARLAHLGGPPGAAAGARGAPRRQRDPGLRGDRLSGRPATMTTPGDTSMATLTEVERVVFGTSAHVVRSANVPRSDRGLRRPPTRRRPQAGRRRAGGSPRR